MKTWKPQKVILTRKNTQYEESAESEGDSEIISDLSDQFWRIPEGVGTEMVEDDSRNHILLISDSEDEASYSHWPPDYEENAEEYERDPSDSSDEEDLTAPVDHGPS